ncbi:fimbrial protein [Serratia proteamaculans]|nr:fimbrial protein [Serratia proteamaculans]
MAQAASDNQTSITVKVTILHPPPCKINDNRTITVDFGDDIMIPRIDGRYKKRPIEYLLDCTDRTSNALKMQIEGTLSGVDDHSLLTSKNDLGVALSRNGEPLFLNTWFNFDPDNKPRLEAVLVKRSGARISGGVFSAGATLKVDYQ